MAPVIFRKWAKANSERAHTHLALAFAASEQRTNLTSFDA